jgi:hypothetical protein
MCTQKRGSEQKEKFEMKLYKILSRVLVYKTGFGLVIGFINHSQVVTTIN